LKCHYLIASGAGRIRYFFGVAIAAVLAMLPFLAVGIAASARGLTSSDPLIVKRIVLVIGLIAVSVGISVFFSRLVLPRFGGLLAALFVFYLALASSDSFGAGAEPYLRFAHKVLPPIHSSLEAAGGDTLTSFAPLLIRLLAWTLALLILALVVFVRKDLIFEE